MIYICTVITPLGEMIARAENNSLTGLWFNDQKYCPLDTEEWIYNPDHDVFKTLRSWLDDYFSGIFRNHDIRIDLHGTEFQKKVWDIIIKIPFGETVTYGEIAECLESGKNITENISENKKSARYARAVGGATGKNPVAILVPCHRVMGADGKLTGYAAGTERKKALLELEKDRKCSI